ncbi:PHP domain-like protein [Metschnikowia bicuspidata var. bicuspidata NRRL YB-4993]|uniref:PHP domain-like protein n=1 Tax=Metschnikowia bicuspidata var. bicuspidata NRRL YB-4993 TaxID=869754 RepID=A0A1A0HA70_9ASCO|nr:PHP domain-like protein [Metschnikowia bicuspidata var. bicuspidata NRRL YB-4993]OBA20911.1 PHP domain-like protein [Metschnikowia bicuspidata var. bicuspidata NRRL YB-4993]
MYDINVPWPSSSYALEPSPAELTNFYNTIAMLHSFGYNYLAINFIVDEAVKLPVNSPSKLNPVPMAELRKRFGAFSKLRLFSRITLVVSDPAKAQSILKINNTGAFDIVAVQPTTEKALQLTVTNLDIDLLSLPMASRLPFFLKHKTVGLALAKGVKFEICYSGLIAGPAGYESSTALGASGHISRKNFFSNCLQLIRASRCRGLVFSSGATEPLHVRNYADVLAIMNSLGLKVSNSKEGFLAHPESVLVKGRLRIKSHKQTVIVGDEAGTDSRAGALFGGEDSKNGVLDDYKKKKGAGKRSLEHQADRAKRVKTMSV